MDARDEISTIRRFNRTVTERLGVLEEHYLSRGRSIGLDRVLWETGRDGLDVRVLRARLHLDSGHLSRQLRALEEEGLVTVRPSQEDRRVRRVSLTDAGVRELAILDRRSDDLVASILAPLSSRQREELSAAAATVQRLFDASAVVIEATDPSAPAARAAIAAYAATLDERFEGGFRPAESSPAADESFRPPAGRFLIATLRDQVVGCVSVTRTGADAGTVELRRLWVSPAMRGLGLGARLVRSAEDAAMDVGAQVVRLETNRALTEAVGLYRAAGYREVPAFNDEAYAHHWFEKSLAADPAPPRSIGGPHRRAVGASDVS